MADDWDALPDAPTITAAPAGRVKDAWDALPDAEPTQPASPGFIDAVKDHVAPVLSAFGQDFWQGWGPDRWGVSVENQKMLAKAGVYQAEGSRYNNPLQASAELLIETIARTLELGSRGLPAVYHGLQGAGVEAGLPRDIVSIPDAFMGSPHPTGIPGRGIAEATRARTITELGQPGNLPRPTVPRDYIHARELGVIGPELSREGTPAEVSARFIQPTVVYHGSPHDFAAFSTDKIGAGEGAQSYGRGLYFAENRATAESYRDSLGTSTVDGRPYSPDNPNHYAAGLLAEFKTPEAAIAEVERRKVRDPTDSFLEGVARRLQKPETLPRIEEKSNLYQVLIHADRDTFLDWDKPLSEQSPQVREALRQLKEKYPKLDISSKKSAAELADEGLLDASYVKDSGENVYHQLVGAPNAHSSLHVAATDALREVGISGIKYLDQGSRTAGEGTHNFVVFDDKSVEITHKNGEEVAPPMTSAPRQRAMAAERTGDDVLKGPKPGEGATGNPWADRFNQFVDKLTTGEDVKQLIRDAAVEKDGFQQARAGDVPLAHVEKVAEAAGLSPDMIDRAGLGRLAKSDGEMRVAMQLMLQATENVRDAARAVKADGSEQSLIKLQETIMQRDLAVEQVVARRAEWGRTGNVIQEFQRRTREENGLSDFLKERGRTPEDLKDIARAIDELDGTQAARVLSEMHKNPPAPFYWMWVNGLISGMLTHSKYVAANALYAASEHGVVTPIASIIGAGKKLLGADVERVYFGEAAAATWGMLGALPEAAIATGKSIWQGQRAVLKSEIELHKEAVARGEPVSPIIDRAVNQISGQGRPTEKLFGVVPLDGIWGRIIGAPGDVAGGIHSFFKILGERAALGAEAYRAAAKEGLSPADADFWRRRSEILENPPTDMMERAIASAYKGTFMQELGPKGKDWQRLTKGNPILKWLFPFSHIPINLMKATYESTPFAFMDAEMRDAITGKKGGVEQDKAVARMVVGSAIMAYFVNASLNGRVTGDYPKDQKERDSWKLSGKQPNSIMIGGYWVSFDKFGPAGNMANLGANIGHIIPMIHDGWTGKDDEGMSKAVFNAAAAAGHMVTNEVGMLSLKMLMEAVEDEKKGAAWVASNTGSLVPFSSFIGQTASGGLPFTGGTLGDPYMREAKTAIDGLKYRLPGLRETLLPKRDFFGEPLPNPQYGNIIRQRLANTDPVMADMERLQIHPGLPQDRIGGVKLSPKLYDEYQVLAGTMAKTALEPLVGSPGWTQLPTNVRIDTIHANITTSRKVAEAVMQARHPELIMSGMQQRIDYITGKSLTKTPKKAPGELSP